MSVKVKKLNAFETYIALVKGYCAMTIIMMPKAFIMGGWGVSALMLGISAILTTVCVVKLVHSGLHCELYSYSMLAERALGRKGKIALDIMIFLCQYAFTISHMSYIVTSCTSTAFALMGRQVDPIYFATATVLILTPMAWVRNIAKFSFTFMIGNVLILLVAVSVCGYAISLISVQGGPGPDI